TGSVALARGFGCGDRPQVGFFVDERASREVKQFSIFRNDHHHVRRNASAGVRLFGAQLMAAKGGGTNHLEAADDQDCRGGGDHPPQEVSSAARHIPVQFLVQKSL